MKTLKEGSSGSEVRELQTRLKDSGFNPGDIDGRFGPGTEAALIGFQKSGGLVADGIAGPRTLAALGLADEQAASAAAGEDVTGTVTVTQASRMCPGAPLGNIKAYLPEVLRALKQCNL